MDSRSGPRSAVAEGAGNLSEAAVSDLMGTTAAAERGPSESGHCSVADGCITCGDVAIPLRVVAIDTERGLALCADPSDRRETVETALVAPVAIGDLVLVHAGTAIATLDDEVTANPAAAESGAEETARAEGEGKLLLRETSNRRESL